MKLSEEVKRKIEEDYNNWFDSQYGNKTRKEKKKLGAVFTPPKVTIQMLEMLDSLDGNILDPCCGSGNLLVAAIIAGADPNNIYGNEYDEEFRRLAQDRLEKYSVPRWHLHQGDATKKESISFDSFSPNYKKKEEPKQVSLWDLQIS